ncbi:MAG: HprK-related kinase A [Chromatiales bacterium]|nr:HprK-related kinase A [Chromatiales bacterium]
MHDWQTVGSLGAGQLRAQLKRDGIVFRAGPWIVRLQSDDSDFAELFRWMYFEAPLATSEACADITLELRRKHGLRRVIRPQIELKTDREELLPFTPFPADHAFALFEWGMNWCMAISGHTRFMLHAAVLERYGRCLILPAAPGSGKSTLCAALAVSGWRLFSDEFGLIRIDDLGVVPMPRPIALKNDSIEIIRRFAPSAEFGPVFPKTRKGDVAHMRPSDAAVRAMDVEGQPAWIVFPTWQAGAATRIEAFPRGRSFLKLTGNSFNYMLLGADGFRTAAALASCCDCYTLQYSELPEAVEVIDQITRSPMRANEKSDVQR